MEKICLNCEQIFKTDSPKKKFCADKCKMAFSRRNKNLTPSLPLVAPKIKTKKVKVGGYKFPLIELPGLPKDIIGLIKQERVLQVPGIGGHALPITQENAWGGHPPAWIKKIEEYCDVAGCTPDDLIEAHQHKTTTIKVKNFEAIKEMGKKLEQKKNISVNKRKEYNPFENRFFNIKTPSSKAKT